MFIVFYQTFARSGNHTLKMTVYWGTLRRFTFSYQILLLKVTYQIIIW